MSAQFHFGKSCTSLLVSCCTQFARHLSQFTYCIWLLLLVSLRLPLSYSFSALEHKLLLCVSMSVGSGLLVFSSYPLYLWTTNVTWLFFVVSITWLFLFICYCLHLCMSISTTPTILVYILISSFLTLSLKLTPNIHHSMLLRHTLRCFVLSSNVIVSSSVECVVFKLYIWDLWVLFSFTVCVLIYRKLPKSD